nr:c-type cytochrome [Kiloniellales bacterium]
MRLTILAASALAFLALALPASAGDAAKGRADFEARCTKCHSLDPTASGYRGPHLARLFERRYGAVEGFPYRMVWTDANPLW